MVVLKVLNDGGGTIPGFPNVFSCKSCTHASKLALLKDGDCAMGFGFVDVLKLKFCIVLVSYTLLPKAGLIIVWCVSIVAPGGPPKGVYGFGTALPVSKWAGFGGGWGEVRWGGGGAVNELGLEGAM